MALADVLSAMRQIILDAPNLPEGAADREIDFRGRFPGLSESEREDLAKISPDKFSLYTVSIFQGEKNILENHFPITFDLIRRHWSDAFSEQLIPRLITQRLHAIRPWTSQSPLHFAKNFCEYVNFDCPALLKVRPDLGDIATLELATYQLRRAADSTLVRSDNHSISLESLPTMMIDELLSARMVVSPYLACLELEYDPLPIREWFYSHDRETPQETSPHRRSLLIGSRNQKNIIYWLRVPAAVSAYLAALHECGKTGTVEEFAAELADELPEHLSEQDIFEHLMKELAQLMAYEYVALTT